MDVKLPLSEPLAGTGNMVAEALGVLLIWVPTPKIKLPLTELVPPLLSAGNCKTTPLLSAGKKATGLLTCRAKGCVLGVHTLEVEQLKYIPAVLLVQ